MSCDKNSARAATGATQSGITKTASQRAAIAGSAQGRQEKDRKNGGKRGIEARGIDPQVQALAKKRALTARNVQTFHEAIQQNRRVSVLYRPVDNSGRTVQMYRNIIPLDVKGGSTPSSRRSRYMWSYSEKIKSPVCMRLDRVIKVEKSEETFEPKAIAVGWKGKKVAWNLPRDVEVGWGGLSPAKKRPGNKKGRVSRNG